jgi:hypothetical protein
MKMLDSAPNMPLETKRTSSRKGGLLYQMPIENFGRNAQNASTRFVIKADRDKVFPNLWRFLMKSRAALRVVAVLFSGLLTCATNLAARQAEDQGAGTDDWRIQTDVMKALDNKRFAGVQ